MTRFIFKKTGDLFVGFSVFGHSGFAKKGEDIVCAAASAVTELTLNGITKAADAEADIEIKEEPPVVSVELTKRNEKAQAMIHALFLEAQLLFAQYPDYVSLKLTEE